MLGRFLITAGGLCLLGAGALAGDGVPLHKPNVPQRYNELAEHFPDSTRVYVSQHFVILHDTSEAEVESRAALLEAAHASFFETLGEAGFSLERSDGRLVCLLFTREDDFLSYAKEADGVDMSWSGGYYSPRTNRVALFEDETPFPWPADACESCDADDGHADTGPRGIERPATDLASTSHEAIHQLAFNSGLQRKGVVYPFWVSEGLAASFEPYDAAQPFGIGEVNPIRQRDLIRAHKRDLLIDFTEFITMIRPPTDNARDTSIAYAQAWSLFNFLFEREPEALRQYMARLADLPPGPRHASHMQRDFEQAFGPVEAIADAWHEHVEQLAAE